MNQSVELFENKVIFNNFRSGDTLNLLNFTMRDNFDNVFIPLGE